MTESPLVTVYLPTYNSEKTIERTLRSILDQTHTNIAIHIVDNHSTDRTLDIIKSIRDPRITVHLHEVHYPVSELNWNRCFDYVRGDYTIICHSDDVYTPNMFKKQVEVFQKNPKVYGVFTMMKFIDDHDKIIKEIPIIDEYKNKNLSNRDIMIATLCHGNTLCTPSAMIRSEMYALLAPFRYELFSYSSDLDMWLRLSSCGRIAVIDEPLLHYRVSSGQDSWRIHHKRTAEEAFFRTVDYHLKDMKDIPEDAIMHYEMRRIEDKLKCVYNAISMMGKNLPKMIGWGIKQKIQRR